MKKTVLIIDDDYFVRTLLNFLLKDHFEVVAIENGFKAMQWLDKGNIPDLILSDVDMPQFDGIHLLNQLRRSGYYRMLPVLILSGHIDPEVKLQCMQAGATAYITKPFNPPDLLNLINHSIQDAAAEEEISYSNNRKQHA